MNDATAPISSAYNISDSALFGGLLVSTLYLDVTTYML